MEFKAKYTHMAEGSLRVNYRGSIWEVPDTAEGEELAKKNMADLDIIMRLASLRAQVMAFGLKNCTQNGYATHIITVMDEQFVDLEKSLHLQNPDPKSRYR